MDIRKKISQKAAEYGLVLSAAGLERITEHGLDYETIFKKAQEKGEWFINSEYLEGLEKLGEAEVCEVPPSLDGVQVVKPKACNIDSKLEVKEKSDVTGQSTCAGKIEDFIQYFNERYERLRSIVQEHVEYKSATYIDQVRAQGDKTRARVVVMVNDKRESNKGYKFLEVEDPTGDLTVLISDKDDRLKQTYERILPDEVIGVYGTLMGDLFIANEITQPDIPLANSNRYSGEEVYAAFLSDIHVGSYLFLEKEFQSFIDWLKGRGNKRDIAERIKYIFIAGDLVDGIGIYPDQEKELTIPDIGMQYEFLALLLDEIPKHIEVVACMGNHDAVRNAEPQPKVKRSLAKKLYEIENLHITGNPVKVNAHGVNILMYHGTSLDTIIGNLSGCSYSRPETAMIEYLKRRHLVPSYGSDSISPERKDFLFIDDVPDIFHCGHVHTNGYTVYRGVTVINSGTWQAKTAFQERLGHQPTPAIVPIVNLQNHEVMMLDFSENSSY